MSTIDTRARQQAARQGQWRRLPLIESRRLRWALVLGGVVYLVLALASVEVNWARVAEGAGRALNFLGAFLQPDFVSRQSDILAGLLESLTMTLTSTVIGVLLAIPVGLGAAKNIAPLPVYAVCRAIIAISRTFQEVIIAILFVVMFGFGPFAGMLTLAFATIGFMAKLLAEDIEDLDWKQVEAVRATGASWWQTMNHAVQPQVMPRLIGLSMYRLDINFRESSVIGIVGAGGIGATLNTSLSRYEYGTSAAILLIIIAIVLMSEYASSHVRRWTQ
ncbi:MULTISPECIES: phosphonate ABC transporter, permease protein PhnE [Halomonadaceae]|jgi:phosphonate transport system permease protein|uniref:phosphonate ABC transporter, permease protein PhnE n=1 Tax=Halomonadaceae TaxID=28256 RepID=UPI00111891B9|nr:MULTISPECIES: phosphonate ABC transporter, permease protein PhnE [Halomonas]MCG7577505.1 phosphonate ABC transporter, permease protein PhnE [Halomonas sp. MMH1-48]MCG7592148.1 phosphonate ABC transporter, permease protein PhnE [Halomonas sp. McD50-5]MCG7604624.1 phosphonate ABC transporter, permease protein PhnE [Halomonas sp. MM17-34]MCG7613704.1 phosphonate ABC transporter, permease protein PhnE [Halomonas sp. MM17-29]MCG7618199.1 phosphonate ABC transporter, permease protein PhnE [Halomo|tara:strand:+ start:908 stop:1735 length:828 start_codon:yes stop_codon:yes gene_type:complete